MVFMVGGWGVVLHAVGGAWHESTCPVGPSNFSPKRCRGGLHTRHLSTLWTLAVLAPLSTRSNVSPGISVNRVDPANPVDRHTCCTPTPRRSSKPQTSPPAKRDWTSSRQRWARRPSTARSGQWGRCGGGGRRRSPRRRRVDGPGWRRRGHARPRRGHACGGGACSHWHARCSIHGHKIR